MAPGNVDVVDSLSKRTHRGGVNTQAKAVREAKETMCQRTVRNIYTLLSEVFATNPVRFRDFAFF